MEKQRKENIKPYELSGRKRDSVFGKKVISPIFNNVKRLLMRILNIVTTKCILSFFLGVCQRQNVWIDLQRKHNSYKHSTLGSTLFH